ncbi:N-6 DNA methylase [Pseudomonas putida]|nr:N-6 DNA methylase [Pseudomonas putida]
MNIKSLKNKIFAITKSLPMNERESQELALRIFIDYCYGSAILAWRRMNFRASMFTMSNIQCEMPYDADEVALKEAFDMYVGMVASSKPFADVFSILTEEIVLSGRKGKSRGKGLGQFFTPEEIAYALPELTFPDPNEIKAWDSLKLAGDICCGAGSLTLAFLSHVHDVDSEKLNMLGLILNDIDELACKSTLVQILSTLMIHHIQINNLIMFNANAITEYFEEGHLYFGYTSPDESEILFDADVMADIPIEKSSAVNNHCNL